MVEHREKGLNLLTTNCHNGPVSGKWPTVEPTARATMLSLDREPTENDTAIEDHWLPLVVEHNGQVLPLFQ